TTTSTAVASLLSTASRLRGASSDPQHWSDLDAQLRSNLGAFSVASPNYWAYMGRDLRAFTHAYFQYPAMMVPAMQGDLLDALIDLNIGIEAVLDPFVGSGTVMTEAMLRGLHFGGQDVN